MTPDPNVKWIFEYRNNWNKECTSSFLGDEKGMNAYKNPQWRSNDYCLWSVDRGDQRVFSFGASFVSPLLEELEKALAQPPVVVAEIKREVPPPAQLERLFITVNDVEHDGDLAPVTSLLRRCGLQWKNLSDDDEESYSRDLSVKVPEGMDREAFMRLILAQPNWQERMAFTCILRELETLATSIEQEQQSQNQLGL